MISDPVSFLANLFLVANANGKSSEAEREELEAIRNEFKFTKRDFKKAIGLVEQGKHTMTAVGSFADQVTNLELMLRMAYADDHLDLAEAKSSLITDFRNTIGIYEDQLQTMRDQVLTSLRER